MGITSHAEMQRDHASSWVGLKGRLGAWLLASWPRGILERLFWGDPNPRLFDELALSGDEIVVDVGCGSGYYGLRVASRLTSGRLIGVDLSDEMLRAFKRRAAAKRLGSRVDLRKGGAHRLPVADASVDRVVTTTVLHELPEPDRVASEFSRVLKPGGRAVVLDFRKPRPGERTHDHGDEGGVQFEATGLAQWFEAAGLVDARAEEFDAWVLGSAAKPG